MTIADSVILLVFGPLLSACAAVVVPARWRWLPIGSTLLALPLLLVPLTASILADGVLQLELAGYPVPVGIRLRVDGLALICLWLVALVGGAAGAHALGTHPPGRPETGPFWSLWLLLLAGMNGLFVSADLFNLYVAIELVTISSIALIAASGQPDALRAAMRYLLLAMLASLAYLLGVALLYAGHGNLDLYAIADGIGAFRHGGQDRGTLTALALISVALLLKAAIFPLHVWLPPAHAQAPGAVSAVLSALVVKTAVYLLYRLWFWTADGLDLTVVSMLLGGFGAAAVVLGSLAALVQDQIKRVVAYSTVAQLGYLMLVFPLLGDPRAASTAWMAAGGHLVAHGLAKAGMFLAAANLMQGAGSGRLDRLAGASRTMPLSLFAFGLAGVSLMGLPPSGGFLAKWLLLDAAWTQRAWGWLVVVMLGSVLAAGYVFRVLAAAFASPPDATVAAHPEAPTNPLPSVVSEPLARSLPALALGISACALGFFASPLFELIAVGPPGIANRLPVPGDTP